MPAVPPPQTLSPLTIEAAELRIVRLPLVAPFTIATGTMTEKLFPLLRLFGSGFEGVSEGVMDPLPDYLEETTAGAVAFLADVLLPGLVGKSFAHPKALDRHLAPWRGNRMALATVEMAFWDLWARRLNLPLQTVLGGEGTAIDVGVSLGIGPIDTTMDRIRAHLDQGYRRIKLKIMPGHDLALLRATRQAFPDAHLTVDANSSYTLADRALLASFDQFDLDYIEQPLAWDDIHDHAVLQQSMATPICLDESLKTVAHTRKALQSDAARVINIKVGRVGGFSTALAIHDLAQAFDVPVWCGGMLESGVGRAHNIHLSTLPNFRKPGDTSSASRYFTCDIIVQKLEASAGRMPVPTGPGTGVDLDHDFLATVSSQIRRFEP